MNKIKDVSKALGLIGRGGRFFPSNEISQKKWDEVFAALEAVTGIEHARPPGHDRSRRAANLPPDRQGDRLHGGDSGKGAGAMSGRHCSHGRYSVVECEICSRRPLRNHPGWGRGAVVRLASGAVAEVVADGAYVGGSDFGAWHYRILYRTGPLADQVFEHIPLMTDTLIVRVQRS